MSFAIPQLLKNPGFTALTLLTLALGTPILEYTNANGNLREGWRPRIRRLGRDGKASTLWTASTDREFAGTKAGDEKRVAGVWLCWCPPGKFIMGSPATEPDRRPGEDQVEVTLTKGFWMGKYEVTQGQWKRVIGEFPGELSAGEGDDLPVYAVNFAEAEGFCATLTERARAAGDLPKEWEFRLPTEA